MSSATTDTYPESVGSCRPPNTPTAPPPSPPPAAAVPRGVPVRRQLDFSGGSDLDDDDDDFLCRVADDIERAYLGAKRRAPPCVCGRGNCAAEWDEQRGRWMYVCPARPKCKNVALCEEVGVSSILQPAFKTHPKPSNFSAFNSPSNQMTDARNPINNINLQGARAITPIKVNPQAAVATTPFKSTFQVAGSITPAYYSPQGAGTTAVVKFSPQGAKPSRKGPICQCRAGKCKVLRVGSENYHVCPIPKGQGACSHKVPVKAAVNEPPQVECNNTKGNLYLKDTPVEKEAHGRNVVQVGYNNPAPPDDEWLFDIIDNEVVPTAQATPGDEAHHKLPSMLQLHQPIDMLKTPTKMAMPPYGTRSPMTPCSGVCFGCQEKGHWIKDCPKSSPAGGNCFHCGMAGHWRNNCPQLRGS